MDLIVGRFADAQIEAFDDAGLDDFERLIEAPNAVYAVADRRRDGSGGL